MIILFEDPNFRDECNNDKLLKRRQGDLRAANDLGAMRFLPGRCHELKGDHHGQLSLDLDHPWRLIFAPADDPPALKGDGGMDWEHVRVIKILRIEDTHD